MIDLRPVLRPNLFDMMRDCCASHAFDYLYMPLGKCANTEVKRFLWQQHYRHGYPLDVPEGYFDVHNYGWRKSYQIEKNPWDGYVRTDYAGFLHDVLDGGLGWRFCFVRNPYARLVSGYLDKIVNSGESLEEASRNHRLVRPPADFGEFADLVADQPEMARDIHWSSQTHRLAYEFFEYDFVGHVESLDDGKAAVAEKLFSGTQTGAQTGAQAGTKTGAARKPKHFTGASDKLRAYYTDAIAEKVLTTFRKDFELFGYSDDYTLLDPVRPVAAPGRYRDVLKRFRGALDAGEDLRHLLGAAMISK